MARSFSATQTVFGTGVVIERAEGYYWKLKGATEEHGPFAIAIDAISDMQDDEPSFDDDAGDDAEFGVGAAAWTDPDSGMLPGVALLHLESYY